MPDFLTRYARWLHTAEPPGAIEALPEVRADGSTRVDGLHVCGDLTGIPLLKVAADTGAKVVDRIAARERGTRKNDGGQLPLLILGGGVSGMSAALQARRHGLEFEVIEARGRFATVEDFPRAKPIFTYPASMQPTGELRLTADVKESLLEELRAQTADIPVRAATARGVVEEPDGLRVELEDGSSVRARDVVVAIGRSGEYRPLGVEGEDLGHVHRRLFDPRAHRGKSVLVVGGGDSAVEAAVALAAAGAEVALSHRGGELVRPKPANLDALRRSNVRVIADSAVASISTGSTRLITGDGPLDVEATEVFAMIGRATPLEFFRRSGIPVRGEWTARKWASLAFALLAAWVLFHWKTDTGPGFQSWVQARGWFPFQLAASGDPSTLSGTLSISMQTPAFWYSLAYSVVVAVFGWLRIRRRKTPYITRQTLTLVVIQVVPLFLLPYLLLPWLGHLGWFESGWRLWLADQLFPASEWDLQGREYWRSVGFILAWPLMIWNVFSDQPLVLWLVISLVQTFVLIPVMVRRWGKGSYCGWICSCGALAETLGDTVRDRMPHGTWPNRLNMIGQGVLAVALVLLVLRGVSWIWPESSVGDWSRTVYMAAGLGRGTDWSSSGGVVGWLNYAWFVDLFLAGVLGVGLYAHFSGRTWCRFGCPLAALMNIYARLGTQFRIFADADRCISCNVCTTSCHQGIDVMHFAQRGAPMDDPQCVRCSACVQSCPTDTLEFGRLDPGSGRELGRDPLVASPVRLREREMRTQD